MKKGCEARGLLRLLSRSLQLCQLAHGCKRHGPKRRSPTLFHSPWACDDPCLDGALAYLQMLSRPSAFHHPGGLVDVRITGSMSAGRVSAQGIHQQTPSVPLWGQGQSSRDTHTLSPSICERPCPMRRCGMAGERRRATSLLGRLPPRVLTGHFTHQSQRERPCGPGQWWANLSYTGAAAHLGSCAAPSRRTPRRRIAVRGQCHQRPPRRIIIFTINIHHHPSSP